MKFWRFLTGSCFAAVFAPATMLPSMSQAQTKLRIQSTFPAKGTFADGGRLWAEWVNALSGGTACDRDGCTRLGGTCLLVAGRSPQKGSQRRAFSVGLLGGQEPGSRAFRPSTRSTVWHGRNRLHGLDL